MRSNSKIQFVCLDKEYNLFKKPFEKDLKKILSSGNYIRGNFVEKFENAIKEKIKEKTGEDVFVVGVNSGTTALFLCMKYLRKFTMSMNTTPVSFWATTEAMHLAEILPIYRDINKDLQIPVVEDYTTVVSLHGHPVPGGYNHRFVVEDNAQCAPLHYNSGCWASTYSLFPSKPLGTCGDGGYIITQDNQFYRWLKRARYHGLDLDSGDRYLAHDYTGTCRLTEIQALYAYHKLQWLEELQHERVARARKYCDYLGITFRPDSYYHVMNINVTNRDKLVEAFIENNIDFNFHYPHTLVKQCTNSDTPFRYHWTTVSSSGYKRAIPKARQYAETCFSLPLHPFLTDEEIDRVCSVIYSTKECKLL